MINSARTCMKEQAQSHTTCQNGKTSISIRANLILELTLRKDSATNDKATNAICAVGKTSFEAIQSDLKDPRSLVPVAALASRYRARQN